MTTDIYRVRVTYASDDAPPTLTAEFVETSDSIQAAKARLRELTKKSGAFQYQAQWKAPEIRDEFLDDVCSDSETYLGCRRYFLGPPPLSALAAKIGRRRFPL